MMHDATSCSLGTQQPHHEPSEIQHRVFIFNVRLVHMPQGFVKQITILYRLPFHRNLASGISLVRWEGEALQASMAE